MILIKKVVYFDYGGSHSSILAANIHAGNLKEGQVPTGEELMALPYFDQTEPRDFGVLHAAGIDGQGNEIYSLGTKHSAFGPILNSLVELMELKENYVLVTTMPYVNLPMRIGGWLSRGVSLPFLGRPLVLAGTRKAYPALADMVGKVKVQLH